MRAARGLGELEQMGSLGKAAELINGDKWPQQVGRDVDLVAWADDFWAGDFWPQDFFAHRFRDRNIAGLAPPRFAHEMTLRVCTRFAILGAAGACRTYTTAAAGRVTKIATKWPMRGPRATGPAAPDQSWRRRSAAAASGVRFRLNGETKRPSLSIR